MASSDLRYRSSAELQEQAERTRAEIAGTLGAIQDRLSSTYWQTRALDARAVVEIVRRHPLPSLLLGAGAFWLVASIARDPVLRPDRRRPLPPLPHDRAPARFEDLAALPPQRRRPEVVASAPPTEEDVAVAPARERAADEAAAVDEAVTARRAATRAAAVR